MHHVSFSTKHNPIIFCHFLSSSVTLPEEFHILPVPELFYQSPLVSMMPGMEIGSNRKGLFDRYLLFFGTIMHISAVINRQLIMILIIVANDKVSKEEDCLSGRRD